MGLLLLLAACILLIAPMSEWLFHLGLPISIVANLPLYFALPITVLALAGYDMKRLYDSKKNVKLRYFAFSVTVTFGISIIALLLILPYFKPNIAL